MLRTVIVLKLRNPTHLLPSLLDLFKQGVVPDGTFDHDLLLFQADVI